MAITRAEQDRLELNEEFKDLRRRYYRLGLVRRLQVLRDTGSMLGFGDERPVKDLEREALFEFMAAGKGSLLRTLIAQQEVAIAKEVNP